MLLNIHGFGGHAPRFSPDMEMQMTAEARDELVLSGCLQKVPSREVRRRWSQIKATAVVTCVYLFIYLFMRMHIHASMIVLGSKIIEGE